MNLNSKADYYQWLMSEHGKIEEMMRKIPKLSIEEQSKRVDMVEYDETNQKKVKIGRASCRERGLLVLGLSLPFIILRIIIEEIWDIVKTYIKILSQSKFIKRLKK